MFSRLFLLFTLLPLVELVLLAWIGSKTSWMLAVGLVLGTGVAGAWLVRRNGWQALQRIRADLAAGRIPGESLFDGLLVFAAGVLLITPGVLSDLAAILLLVPVTRNLVKRYLKYRFSQRVVSSFTAYHAPGPGGHDKIIDVRVIDSPPAEH